jgi:hypothetical protein
LHDLSNESSYLGKVGWFDSFYCNMAVDRARQAIPWLTYPAIAFLETRLHQEMTLFEYGSGNSTIWWASHVARVVSCEHDMAWYEKMKPELPVNVDYVFADLTGGYADVINQHNGEFDVVVIDGRERVECARNSLGALKPDGVIVWDNTDRDRYQPGYDFLRDAAFRQIDFHGMSPIIAAPSCTSVFYRADNCFGI